MPILWEWLRKGSIRKSFEKQSGARTSGAYGPRFRFDQTAPDRIETFTGEGFDWDEVEELIAIANTPTSPGEDDGYATVTDHLGQDWKGAIASLSWDPVSDGGTIYWVLQLELDNPEKL